MRTSRTAALGATVALLTAGLWTVTQATGASAAHDQETFFIHDTKQTRIDANQNGDQGDQFVFHGLTYTKKGGKQIGRFGGSCTILQATRGLSGDWSCNVDYVLPGGQLHTEIFQDPKVAFNGKPFAFSILGGTGKYRNARGEGTMAIPTNVKDQTDGYVKLNLING